jgi:Na+/melibiose symporter-like transporter
MGIYTHIFYLPIYFQAVKGTTAEGSGIRCIAYLVSNTIASIVVGGSITALGYYTPFTWFGTAIFTIGSGMLFTLKVNTDTAKWIGYQILTGFGSGAAIQIPFIAVQVVLDEKDMPTGSEYSSSLREPKLLDKLHKL